MSHATLSVVVFVLVMIVIISEKVHRAVVAVGGAVLLIILGVLDIETGVSYIDYNTIGLLIGMMLFVAVVKHSGIFEYLAVKSAKIAKGDPWKICYYQGDGSQSGALYHDADPGIQYRWYGDPDRRPSEYHDR